MKIVVKKAVNIDIDGSGGKIVEPSKSIIEIDDNFAKEENLVLRYEKFPKHIEIVEYPTDYNGLTEKQLKDLCKEKGIEFPTTAKKEDLIALLGSE